MTQAALVQEGRARGEEVLMDPLRFDGFKIVAPARAQTMLSRPAIGRSVAIRMGGLVQRVRNARSASKDGVVGGARLRF